ncbi:gliding motility-associated C-terminal domain-containing protein [Hymenobacter canadensis]|uniref:Gliding motility-associated C-terminal domain-containing protein n=1 Tax=Hymenobacter canadensis TaxID=2999067 RepID=A0ABY7LQH2_9BACT|nr:gliding motility-associated C-terminal domain-containing protein [Hymenobacter canadensis]WBA42665.1 gliding motility-associated C-terminal domain-containing protein [Hymenobacter canadensis]
MRSVKFLYLWLLLGALLATKAPALAQPCTSSPNPPACTFVAVDVLTNRIVEKLCVGRAVRFDLCAGRPPLVYFYQVLPGTNTYPNPCGPGLRPSPFIYTPTAAGPVTVTENGQAQAGGGVSTIYFRVFEVYDNPIPAFTAAACSPGFVQLTLPGAPYNSYSVQIGSSTFAAQPGQVRTFAVPAGATSITVAGVYSDSDLCTRSATQPLLQLAAPGPLVIQRLSVQGSSVVLETAPLVAGYLYTVEQADFTAPTTFQAVPGAVANGLSGFTVPAGRPGYYRLRRTDICQQAQAVSEPVSTLTLTVQPAERRNELAWQFGPSPATYELTRNGTALPAPPPTARSYSDTAVACGIRYTYRLTARYAGGVTSVSEAVSVLAAATQAPATPRLVATFDERNRVVLTASVARFPSTGQLTYLRDNTVLGTTAARALRDSLASYSPDLAPCYQVRFEDDCANRSAASAAFCPAVLAAELAGTRNSAVRLRWSGLRGAPAATDSLRYRLLVLNPDNSVRNSYAVGSRGTYLDQLPPTDLQAVRYRLEVTGAGLPAASYSNIASVVRPLEAYVPTAFTPNGDGLNDVLEVKGRFLRTYTFTVVDRNGQEVFRGTDRTQAWDGRIRGQPPVLGAYVWRFEAVDAAGKTVVQHGTVTIVK